MTPAARIQAAIEILEGLGATAKPADRFLRDWFRMRRYAGSKDRAAVAERVFDVFRHRASYAWRMQSEAPRALAIASVLAKEGDVPALFDGSSYGPKPLDDAELTAIHAPLQGEPPLFVRGEFPAFLEGELTRSLGASLPTEMNAMQARAPVDLRVNTLRATRTDVITRLRQDGFDAQAAPFSPYGVRIESQQGLAQLHRHEAFEQGWFEFQDEAAQIATLLAHAKPGMRVLDLAAGAGGKALGLAAEMKDQGAIVAHDIDIGRLFQIAPRATRAGVTIIRPTDGSLPDGVFDLVFLDAPCSGSGSWRRQPEQKWRLTPERLAELIAIQSELLDLGTKHTRLGGRLLYATCSILRSENEGQIEAFRTRHPKFTVVRADETWAAAPPPGMAEFFRATPTTTGTDGFFAAIFVRKE